MEIHAQLALLYNPEPPVKGMEPPMFFYRCSEAPFADQVQEGEHPNRLDPKNPVYAEETSPSVIVNGFSERLQASHIQKIRPHSENLVGSHARSVTVHLALNTDSSNFIKATPTETGRDAVGFSMKRAVAVVEEAAENNGSGSTVLCTMTIVSRKVSIQTDQDPKKPIHADKTRPSAIVNGLSISPHVSDIQRIRFDHMLVQSQSSWPWTEFPNYAANMAMLETTGGKHTVSHKIVLKQKDDITTCNVFFLLKGYESGSRSRKVSIQTDWIPKIKKMTKDCEGYYHPLIQGVGSNESLPRPDGPCGSHTVSSGTGEALGKEEQGSRQQISKVLHSDQWPSTGPSELQQRYSKSTASFLLGLPMTLCHYHNPIVPAANIIASHNTQGVDGYMREIADSSYPEQIKRVQEQKDLGPKEDEHFGLCPLSKQTASLAGHSTVDLSSLKKSCDTTCSLDIYIAIHDDRLVMLEQREKVVQNLSQAGTTIILLHDLQWIGDVIQVKCFALKGKQMKPLTVSVISLQYFPKLKSHDNCDDSCGTHATARHSDTPDQNAAVASLFTSHAPDANSSWRTRVKRSLRGPHADAPHAGEHALGAICCQTENAMLLQKLEIVENMLGGELQKDDGSQKVTLLTYPKDPKDTSPVFVHHNRTDYRWDTHSVALEPIGLYLISEIH
ncbi:hypothetical protein U0070_022599 [Myodes glareolus]|uniref:Uncharacterized protein n=1 Tax=Myodes glareolus TaxID=447135 RepID=A0AAW0J0B8_MYOGA